MKLCFVIIYLIKQILPVQITKLENQMKLYFEIILFNKTNTTCTNDIARKPDGTLFCNNP